MQQELRRQDPRVQDLRLSFDSSLMGAKSATQRSALRLRPRHGDMRALFDSSASAGQGEMQLVSQDATVRIGDLRSPCFGSASAEGDETQDRTWGAKPGVGDVRSSPHDRPTPRRFKGAAHRCATSPLSRQDLRPVEGFHRAAATPEHLRCSNHGALR